MAATRVLARVFAAGALLAAAGCVRWTHLAPGQLQINGKAGQLCSAAATPLIWGVNAALFPVSVASLGRERPSHDNLGYPGLAVENAAYFACATLGLPLHALGWGAERLSLLLASREQLEDLLIDRLPYLSAADYALLVRTAQRSLAPVYERAAAVGAGPPDATADPRPAPGLWSTAQAPRYGRKPALGNGAAAAEWRDWRAAGRPRGAAATAFGVDRALEEADPEAQYAATYGPQARERFDAERAARLARADALERSGDADAAAAALADPSPLLRAAGARLIARSGDARRAEDLARLLQDRAVPVRAAAADALAALALPGSAPALGRAAADPAQLVRERAACALARIGSTEAADLLTGALGSLRHRARFEALCAAARTAGAGSGAALARAQADPDQHTRIAAAAAIDRCATAAPSREPQAP